MYETCSCKESSKFLLGVLTYTLCQVGTSHKKCQCPSLTKENDYIYWTWFVLFN